MIDILKKIPPFGTPSEPAYDCGDGSYMLLARDKTKEDMDSFVKTAGKSGFEVFDETSFGKNFYTTLIKDGLFLHVYFCDCEGTLRVVADEKNEKYLTSVPSVERKCQTSLWQFEVDHSLIDCGMCYIIRCCDGSFFIIDSAHVYSIHDNDRIYKFLRERTPRGEKIKIAGWFFSHGHVDHIGKFCDFLKYNCDDVEIDALYYNFVPLTHPDNIYWEVSDKIFQANFDKLVAQYPNIKKVKLHSGQHFFVKNLEFRVLCTHEDVYPQNLQNFNDSSTMLMMYADSATVSFPGDAGHIESDIVTSRFGSLLKCDIMQAAHHGHFGTTALFYELSDADVIMFPTTQIKFDEEYEAREINREAVAISDECYIASNGTVQLDLPYEKGTAKHFDDETFEDFDGIYNLWGYTYTDERKAELKAQFIAGGGKS